MNREVISADAHEPKQSHPVAVASTARVRADAAQDVGPRESRMIVIGNAFMSRNDFTKHGGVQDMLLNSMAWLTENEELIAIRPTGAEDPPLVLTPGEQRAVEWLASLGVVQLVALAGACAYVLRRRRV